MALIAAAVCPHPPLLVPEVASGAAPELDVLRIACAAAVGVLRGADPELLVVVGSAPSTGEVASGTRGSFAGFGVAREVVLGSGEGRREHLPLALAVGAWVLEASAYAGDVAGYGVAPDASAGDCAAIGRRLADQRDRVVLLVMGDASACRSPKAPGSLDDRAEAFDGSVADALGSADTAALLGLDADLAVALMVAGRPAWQVLAGAAEGGSWQAAVTYDDAPYGVGYLVATWRRTQR